MQESVKKEPLNLNDEELFVNLAATVDNAESRYQQFKDTDPFPSINSGLLNSADIYDYIRLTSIVYPFKIEQLKSAAYEICLGTKILSWNDKGEKNEQYELHKGTNVKFARNSITFVSLESGFRIPDYIALRFNLVIQYVHKGLLLGTGPLINPGFCGELLIPIHNLTNNDCNIQVGTPLISVEFTKLTDCSNFKKVEKEYKRFGTYRDKRTTYNDCTFVKFAARSFQGTDSVVQSSLGPIVNRYEDVKREFDDHLKSLEEKTDKVKTEFEKQVKTVKDRNLLVSIISIFAIMGSVFALFWMTVNVVNDANKYVHDAALVFKDDTLGKRLYLRSNDSLISIEKKLQLQYDFNNELLKKYKSIEDKFSVMQKTDSIQITTLTNKIEELNKQLHFIKGGLTSGPN
jgi:deoxycytidine triphosphate deaminase